MESCVRIRVNLIVHMNQLGGIFQPEKLSQQNRQGKDVKMGFGNDFALGSSNERPSLCVLMNPAH